MRRLFLLFDVLLFSMPLFLSAMYPLQPPHIHEAIIAGNHKQVKLLLKDDDRNYYILDGHRNTPLHTLLDYKNLLFPEAYSKIKQLLLKKKHNFAIQNQYGNNLLHYACRIGDVDLAQIILHKMPSLVAAQNNAGDIPLHLVCDKAHQKTAQLLLAAGSNIYAKNNKDLSPLFLAFIAGSTEIKHLFLRQKPDLETLYSYSDILLHDAALQNDAKLLRALLVSCDLSFLNRIDSTGYTPLMRAGMHGHHEVVEVLLQDPRSNPTIRNIMGQSAIHFACYPAHKKCLRLVLEYTPSAQINAQTRDKQAPLHIACIQNSQRCIAYLVKNNANVTLQDIRGRTPLFVMHLHNTLGYCSTKIKNILVHARDKHQNTMLHLCTGPINLSKDEYGREVIDSIDDYIRFLVAHNVNLYARNEKKQTALDVALKVYKELYDCHMKDISVTFYQPLINQRTILHSFLRIIMEQKEYALLLHLLKVYGRLPPDIINIILFLHDLIDYELNVQTILAHEYVKEASRSGGNFINENINRDTTLYNTGPNKYFTAKKRTILWGSRIGR
jgi:ankyrin repeat protein